MSMLDNTAETRETPTRAGTARDDKLAEAWLDANRQAVEANTFFALTIEPDATFKIAPGGKGRTWVPPTPDRLDSTRAMRA